MKKLFIIIVLMAMAMNGFAQTILHYDFSAVCETGQTLYYLITSEEEHTVTLTYPYSEENSFFQGNFYEGFPEPQGEIILPSTVTHNSVHYSVNAIDSYAFYECGGLIGDLVIPNGVVSIGEGAFSNSSFTSIFIPRSVNFIAPTAFSFCASRDFISIDEENQIYYSENNAIIKRDGKTLVLACNTTTIPDHIEIIGSYAFSGVGNGGDLVIPNSVKTIEQRAFTYSQYFGSLILSESLETIGYEAFRDCRLTGSLTIPNSVTEIEAGAFLNTDFTGNLSLPSSISNISGHTFAYTNFTGTLIIPNSVTNIGSKAFYGTDFTELVLGSSIETISFGAFEECLSLSGTLHLPSSITEIGVGAFRQTSFDEIYSHNTVPPTLINSSVFDGYDINCPIHIPFGCTEAYQNAEGWNYFTNFIEEVPFIYTDFEPDTCMYVTGAAPFEIDINRDGQIDLWFSGYVQHGALMMTTDMSEGWEYCKPYPEENTILNEDTLIWKQTRDDWFGSGTFMGRIGLRKRNGDQYCYGWMKVYCDTVPTQPYPGAIGRNTYVDQMAFCTIPDYPLRWGQTSLESFILDNSEWYYEILNNDGSITYQHLECAGDTTINNERPKVLVRSNTQYDRDSIITTVTHEYVYDKNGKLYWWNKDLEEFTVLYDLTAEPGDEWEIKVGSESLIMHVDVVENYEYEGKIYRILSVSDENDLFSGNIVCGIGHLTSFFPEQLMNQDKGYRVEGLRCYWVEDELVFKYGDDDCDAVYAELHNGIDEDGPSTGSGTAEALVVYPNPTDGYLVLETQSIASLQTQTYRITNLMGQTLLQGTITAETQQIDITRLPAGMYFINVNEQTAKFVVK